MLRFHRIPAVSLAFMALAACGGGGGGDDGGGGGQPPTFRVGGTVTGLTQGSVILRLNGANDLTVSGNASGSVQFTFTPALTNGTSYTVTVVSQPNAAAQPVSLVCGPPVTNATGTINGANVTNVAIACASYSVGGTVSGLKAGSQLTLSLNGPTRTHNVAANGAFTFPTATALGINAAYGIAVTTQPAGQTCTIEGALGLIRATDPNVATAAIVCVDNITDPISGTYQLSEVNGESALDLELRDFITFYPDGTFILGLSEGDNPDCGVNGGALEYGVYNWLQTTHDFEVVRAIRYPATPFECGLDENVPGTLVKRGDGSLLLVSDGDQVVFAPVPSVAGELTGGWGDNQWFIAYAANGTFFSANSQAIPANQLAGNTPGVEDGCYTLSGTRIMGSFTTNMSATCSVSSNQTARDTTGASFGASAFAVQPRSFTVTGDSQSYTVIPGLPVMGTIGRIAVAPTQPSTFSIGGTITGLAGTSGVNLRLNGQTGGDFNTELFPGAANFVFTARLLSGDAYSVGIVPQHQPENPTQFCNASAGGAGTILASDITDVVITCVNSASYTVSGTVSGLAAGRQVTLRARYYDVTIGAEGAFTSPPDLVVAANGPYSSTTIPANTAVFLGILNQPVGQTCTMTRGTLFSTGLPIASVTVTCVDNVTGPLSGTYSLLDADGRGYVNFNVDGTLTTVLIHRDPDPANQEPPADCSVGIPALDQRNGNGVEYGVFSWNSSTGATQLFDPPAVDTNGDCGFWEPGVASSNPWGIVTRAGNGVTLENPPGDPDPFLVTAQAVASVPGSLVGAWVPEANNGTLLVFHADGTFMLAETQHGALFPYGYGQERGCYTESTADSTIVMTIAAGCRPDGRAPYDLNFIGGLFQNGTTTTHTTTGPIPYTLSGDTLQTFGRIFKRTVPN